jgi:hypothetical protein
MFVRTQYNTRLVYAKWTALVSKQSVGQQWNEMRTLDKSPLRAKHSVAATDR